MARVEGKMIAQGPSDPFSITITKIRGENAAKESREMAGKLLYDPIGHPEKYGNAYTYLELVMREFPNPNNRGYYYQLKRYGHDYEIYKTSPTVKREAVKIIQKALVKLGLLPLSKDSIDGIYGDKTQEALSKFQTMICEPDVTNGERVTSRTIYFLAGALQLAAEAEESGVDVKTYWQSKLIDIISGENIGPVKMSYDKNGIPLVEKAMLEIVERELNGAEFQYTYGSESTYDHKKSKYVTAALAVLGRLPLNPETYEKTGALMKLQHDGGMEEQGTLVGDRTISVIIKVLEKRIKEREK